MGIAAVPLLLTAIAAALAFLTGYWHASFLSDDLGQVALFGDLAEQGRMGDEVLRRFFASIDGVNAFYRPLTYASFAANFVLSPADARPWLAVNLLAHGANAALIAWLVIRLASERSRATFASALVAGMLFLVFPSNAEVACWIAGRYDAFALLFTLVAIAAFVESRANGDASSIVAWLACLAALLSKESGALALAGVAVFAAVGIAQDGRRAPGDAFVEWLRRLWPWIFLGAAYGALRWWIFGSPIKVYVAHRPPFDLFGSVMPWARAVFMGTPGLAVLGLLTAAWALFALRVIIGTQRPLRQALVAAVALAGISVALLLPHAPIFEASGIGGRLFYHAVAFGCLTLGLVGSAAMRLHQVLTVVLVIAFAVPGIANIARHVRVQGEMRAVEAAVLGVARAEPQRFHLVIVPAVIEGVPFVRNAQPGLMLPPIQPEVLSHRLLVQADEEIPELEAKIRRGVIGALRKYSVFPVAEGRVPPDAWVYEEPDRSWCWSHEQRALVPMSLAQAARSWATSSSSTCEKWR